MASLPSALPLSHRLRGLAALAKLHRSFAFGFAKPLASGAGEKSNLEPDLPLDLLDELESLSAQISADPAISEALNAIEPCRPRGPRP